MVKENAISLDEIKEEDIPEVIPAKLINSRVIIFNSLYGSYLYVNNFYGSPLGINKPRLEYYSKPTELSLIEAQYLLESGRISIFDVELNKNLTSEEFFEFAKNKHNMFEDKYKIYKDLRDKGYVVRPALKFGADFAVYKKGPGLEHSPFIIQVLRSDSNISAMELVRAGRLATSVRKRFIIANPQTKTYYVLKWFKP
ncbi:MAG: tRNA-intron lyase [Candidatus Lokiarchaeota archaeon]|nr:tRNA-intron lyase [Candidatus Lokiarchaeota archaeon]